MDAREQNWLETHIPHRVRAAIARLPKENSILRVTATIDPQQPSELKRFTGDAPRIQYGKAVWPRRGG
jgi:hypothetical protein